MNINRNILKIVAGALLMVSLPAGAQVLGGNLGGAANGAMSGTLRGASMHGGAAAAGGASVDATGPVGSVRDRAQHAGGRSREVAGSAVGTTRSRVDSTRGTAAATAHTAHAVGANAGQRAASSASQAAASTQQSTAAQTSARPGNGVALDGASYADTEQRALGRTVSAGGAADWQASGNRSNLSGGANSEAGVSVKKDEAGE